MIKHFIMISLYFYLKEIFIGKGAKIKLNFSPFLLGCASFNWQTQSNISEKNQSSVDTTFFAPLKLFLMFGLKKNLN